MNKFNHFSFTKCELLIANLLKIGSCKLVIEVAGGRD